MGKRPREVESPKQPKGGVFPDKSTGSGSVWEAEPVRRTHGLHEAIEGGDSFSHGVVSSLLTWPEWLGAQGAEDGAGSSGPHLCVRQQSSRGLSPF